ncbi:MAG: serine hydrolase domain-containing protein [Sediminispirochaetaceae bacterium]
MGKRTSLTALFLCLTTGFIWSAPTETELQDLFDEAVPELMGKYHVAGAVVGVTDSSRTLFQKGYGKADIAAGIPADPETTLFRCGSISKLFTWTAIMQLEEPGLLELSDPVEKYIGFDLPKNYSEPVRIIDLMNHTPGFEDRLIGLLTTDAKYYETLEQSVRDNIPRRVAPPGEASCYSNYGTMLAGYIVQRITGTSYDQYVEKNIFEPLNMKHSSMIQPPPLAAGSTISKGYSYSDGRFIEEPFEFANGAPAGALSSTASDMLRFYRAYLREGAGEPGTILQPRTVRKIRMTSFRHDPRANGMAHGFIEIGTDTEPILGHGGDTIFFHSLSAYLPDRDWAFFISTNTGTGSQLGYDLEQMLLDEFVPAPDGKTLAAAQELEVDLEEYTGFYSMDRRAESDPTQIMSLMALIRPTVTESGDGLFLKSIIDPTGSVYLPVDEDIFQQANGRMRVVFLRDAEGRVESIYSNDAPVFLFSRPPWIEHPLLNLAVFGFAILLLISALFVPPTGLLSLIPRFRQRSGGSDGALTLVRIGIWTYLALIAAQIVLVLSLGNIIFIPLGPVHAIPLYLAVIGLIAALGGVVLLWKKNVLKPAGRIYLTVFAGSQVLLIAFLGYWGFFFV